MRWAEGREAPRLANVERKTRPLFHVPCSRTKNPSPVPLQAEGREAPVSSLLNEKPVPCSTLTFTYIPFAVFLVTGLLG